jgi:hypothetical protein
MHRLATLFVSFIAVTLPLAAQDSPRVEVFGGYQYLHAGNFDHAGDSINTNGWDLAAAFNFTRHLGVTADFSGSYKQGNGAQVHIYTYTFLYLHFRARGFPEHHRKLQDLRSRTIRRSSSPDRVPHL